MPKQTFFNLPEEKRQRIIEMALQEFANHPYGKASLSGIVARAGIAKGSMYQYFADKKDLYLYLIDLAAKEKIAYIQQGVDQKADFFTLLEQTILVSARFNLDHPRLGQVLANIMVASGEEVLQEVFAYQQRMTIEYFQQMLIQAQERGNVRKDLEPGLVAHILYSILGPALADYFLSSLGVSCREFLANPHLAEELTETKIKDTVDEVMKILRSGLTAQQPEPVKNYTGRVKG